MKAVLNMAGAKPDGEDLVYVDPELTILLEQQSLPEDLLESEFRRSDSTYQFFCDLREVLKVLPESGGE